MNRKVKSFKRTLFLSEQCAVSEVTSVRSSLSALAQAHNRLPLVYCPVYNTLCEVSPEIRCFRYVKSLLLLWKPRSWF